MLNNIYQSLDPVAFSIGPLTVRWYGIAYVLGFICVAFIMWRVAKKWKVRFSDEALMTVMLCAIIGVILGARLGYCLFYGVGYYFENPAEIFLFSNGGMSFHGGLIGALLGGILAAKLTGIPYLILADIAVIGAPLGLFFGRCANFINGELWGAPTDAPWGVVFANAGGIARHPSQLYEAFLEGLVIFAVLYVLSRKTPPRPRGTFLGTFLVMYGVFRFCIEFVRLPDAQLGYLLDTTWLTMGQVLSVPLILAGVLLLVFAWKMRLPQVGLCEEVSESERTPECEDSHDRAQKDTKKYANEDANKSENPQENAHDEAMDIYDIHQNPLGYTKLRRNMLLDEGEYVLYVLAIIQDEQGNFLITRRGDTKKWAAGHWEVQGGGVRAGESCSEAVVREVFEEVGLDIEGVAANPIYSYDNTDLERKDNYIVNIYHLHINFSESSVRLCEREASEFKLASWDEICKINEEGKFLHFKRICEAMSAEGYLSNSGEVLA